MNDSAELHKMTQRDAAVVWLGVHAVCIMHTVMAAMEGSLLSVIWFYVGLCLAVSAYAVLLAYTWPEVILTETGVSVRAMRKKRFYPWADIRQAGVLFLPGWLMPHWRLFLVPSDGSMWRDGDKTFLIRNITKLIWVPDNEETRGFVAAHYGPLDFDLRT